MPFRGAGPGVIDVVGGHTKAINATISTLSPHIRGGKLRALGVSGTKRSPVLPEVPTIEEGGVTGYDAGNWIRARGAGGHARGHHRKAAQGNLDHAGPAGDPEADCQ